MASLIQKRKDTKEKARRRKLMVSFREELVAKPTFSQKLATKYCFRVGSYFNAHVSTEKIIDKKYILDIYFDEIKTAIEIDGGIHKSQIAYDDARDEYLKEKGILVIRFTNDEVKNGEFKKYIWHVLHSWYVNQYERAMEKAKDNGITFY